MKKYLSLIYFALFLTCNTNGVSTDECKEHSCSNCYRILDENDNFVAQGSLSSNGTGLGIAWNGTDCNGNKVPCGKYLVVVNYGSKVSSMATVVTDENTVIVSGEKTMDSLRAACAGKYFEFKTENLFLTEVQGFCCQ